MESGRTSLSSSRPRCLLAARPSGRLDAPKWGWQCRRPQSRMNHYQWRNFWRASQPSYCSPLGILIQALGQIKCPNHSIDRLDQVLAYHTKSSLLVKSQCSGVELGGTKLDLAKAA